MTNKNIFLLMSLFPLFFCAQNAQGMLRTKPRPATRLKINNPEAPPEIQKLPSTYRFSGKTKKVSERPLPFYVGSVPRLEREEQQEVLRSKLILKKVGDFFYPGEFDAKQRMCQTQRISTRSRPEELRCILWKTNRLNEIGPDQKASIKLLIKSVPKQQLRENFKFLSDKNGNNLLFFAAKEDDPSLFERMLECACPKTRRCAIKQKNKFGTSVFDVLNKMEKNRQEKFQNLLVKYGVLKQKAKKLNKSLPSQ